VTLSPTPPDARLGPPGDARNVHTMTTERLVVTVPEPEDAPALYTLVGQADREAIVRTLLWEGPDSRDDVTRWIERCRHEPFEPFGFHWVLRDRTGALSGASGTPLGSIGTRPRETPGRADLGYWLGRPYWGRGLMAEAIAAVVALDFDTLGMAKIEADVFTFNARGQALLEKVGFTREGTIRHSCRKRGCWVDQHVYGLLPGELRTAADTSS